MNYKILEVVATATGFPPNIDLHYQFNEIKFYDKANVFSCWSSAFIFIEQHPQLFINKELTIVPFFSTNYEGKIN